MKTIVNFRALAQGLSNKEGKKLKENTIFRCGVPNFASEEEKQTLKEELNVQVIYDFRSQSEVDNLPSLEESGFVVKFFDILSDAEPGKGLGLNINSVQDMNTRMESLYRDSFATTTGYAEVFKQCEKHLGEPFLFHCTAGRDRTGIMGALLMMILDFEEDKIMEEYLRCDIETLRKLAPGFAQRMGVELNEAMMTNFEEFIKPAQPQLKAFLDRIKEDYDSFNQYLEVVCGIDQEKKEQYKRAYLEG